MFTTIQKKEMIIQMKMIEELMFYGYDNTLTEFSKVMKSWDILEYQKDCVLLKRELNV